MPELQSLRADHGPALLDFERDNRDYFAGSVPDRGDAYFTEFASRHAALLAEQDAGDIAFHLLVDEETGEVLGRFNLVDLADGAAEVGYRLAEKATGRGLATGAVRELCGLAATRYGLHTLRAGTDIDNAASRAVLSRTGFVPTGPADFDGRAGLSYVRHSPAVSTPGFDAFRLRAEADRRVLGVVLCGPQAHDGMPADDSDREVYVVVADGTEGELAAAQSPDDASLHDLRLGVVVLPLSRFRTHATSGSGSEGSRYSFTHARVLKDTTEGTVRELVAAKGALSGEEATEAATRDLHAFLNSASRSLRNARENNPLATQLDAAESLPHYLGCLFALHGRVRPYHKHLNWELTRHPLGGTDPRRLLPLLAEALAPETAARAVRRLLHELEPLARASGHGPALDSWGEDLASTTATATATGSA